jgi:hypothetical protein
MHDETVKFTKIMFTNFFINQIVFAEPLKVARRTVMSLKEHSLTTFGLVRPFGVVRTF